MNELALFAGAGGGLLGTALLGWRCVCAVEKEPYRREVLLRRQRDGVLPLFPIWDDIRTFRGRPWVGAVDVVTAGFPCQPHSAAGKRRGALDERNLWPDTARILREVRPRVALLENVPGLISNGFLGTVLGDLAHLGYDARWGVLAAADVGAPHLRKRVWIVAHAASERFNWSGTAGPTGRDESPDGGSVADTERDARQPRRARDEKESAPGGHVGRGGVSVADADQQPTHRAAVAWAKRNPWTVEPCVGRVADGVAHRVDRLGAIGDGQVPAVVAAAWGLLMAMGDRE